MDWTGVRMTPPGAQLGAKTVQRVSRSMDTRIGVIGFSLAPTDELERRMLALEGRVLDRQVGRAVDYAMTPVVGAARRRCVHRSGTLAHSLQKKLRKYPRTHKIVLAVRPDPAAHDPKTGERPAKIAHLIEFGTEPHEIHLSGPVQIRVWLGAGEEASGYYGDRWVAGTIHHPGSAPKPFLRPALVEQKDNVIARYRSRIIKGVDEETRKLAGGG
jgi:hypothetical protein